MFYPDSVIEDVRSANDIVGVISQYLTLTQKGGNYFGLCPFHREKSPSFSVSADKQLYHCFGCGASGNVITFIMRKENYDFRDAVIYLADRARIALPEPGRDADFTRQRAERDRLLEIHLKAARFYYDRLQGPEGAAAVSYLDGRGIAGGARKRFGLGFSGGIYNYLSSEGYTEGELQKSGLVTDKKRDRFYDRLMFPIFNVHNKVIAFGGRVLGDGEPKYLNSPETPIFSKSRNLYGLNYARLSKTREFILAEGYMDVIALHQFGFTNACASLGTAFTAEHAALLRKYCDAVVLLFDSDGPGEKAALRAIPTLTASGLSLKVLRLSGAKDPDEFLKAFGREKFAEALKTAQSHVIFQLECIRKQYDLSDIALRTKFAQEGAALLAKLGSAIERDAYAAELARMAGLTRQAVDAEVARLLDGGMARIEDYSYKNKPHVFSSGRDAKRADEARRCVLNLLAEGGALADGIAACLSAEEMADGAYVKLFGIILSLRKAGAPVVAAELVSRFETERDQALVSKVFSLKPPFDGDERLKALNDHIGIIKYAFEVEKAMAEEDWAKKGGILLENRRKLGKMVLNNHRWIE